MTTPVDSALEPAFPQGLNTGQPPGLSKREYIASLCLQGILSNKGIHKLTIWSAAQSAVMFADQLLAIIEGKTPDDAALQAPSELQFAAGPGRQ